MVVGELLVAMRDVEFLQSPHEPARAIQEVELIPLAAVDVERLQATQIVRLCFESDHGVVPQPIRPAFLDDLAGVECDRQPDPKKLRRIRIVTGRHGQDIEHLEGTVGVLLG